MKPLPEAYPEGGRLHWVRPGREQAYVLPDADDLDVLASLDVRQGARRLGLLTYAGVAEAADGAWRFERSGALRRRTSVLNAANGQEIARFHDPLMGSTLIGLGGSQWRWLEPGPRSGAWYEAEARDFRTKPPLLRFHAEISEVAGEPVAGVLDLESRAMQLGGVSLLALLGWYLTIIHYLEQLHGVV